MLDTEALTKLAGEGAVEGPGIERQINLSWRDAFRISIRNVIIRIGRAVITGLGIVLGIAFLSSVWTGGVIQEGLERSQIKHERELAAATSTDTEQAGEESSDAAAKMTALEEQRKARASRQAWLVIMSLLVCGVGITNAMLMSVTERFQEIGTMKCLGALDSFIVRLFLIESAVLGLLGSLAGMLLGHLAMIGIFAIREGSLSVVAKMDWGQMLTYLAMSVVIGTLLSLAAAIAPAVRAARMRPAVALQTEI